MYIYIYGIYGVLCVCVCVSMAIKINSIPQICRISLRRLILPTGGLGLNIDV